VRALLGRLAADALDRGEPVPARLVLARSTQPLATVVSLLLLRQSVPKRELERALGDDVAALQGWLRGGEDVRSSVELAPHGFDDDTWWLASDWPPRLGDAAVPPDHVLGVGGASRMLVQCTVRPDVGRALDVGTGCGVQALHLARHSRSVVATDISDRALRLASFNAALNRVPLELRSGSLFEPVAGERFDLVVANPPFVIGAPAGSRREYRDAGRPGDEVCAALVASAHEHLSDGGWCQLLANWEIRASEDWSAGPRSWLAASPLDAWVVQREIQDPAEYAETWLRDAHQHLGRGYQDAYEVWLRGLQARDVVGVGFGLVTLRAGGHDEPVRRLLHHDGPMAQPTGPAIQAWFQRQDELRSHPAAAVLMMPLRIADGVRLASTRPLGAHASTHSLVQETGLRFEGSVDAFGVRLLDRLARAEGTARCEPVGEVVAALALEAGLDPAEVLAGAVPVLRRVVEEGFLEPADTP
jgi:methylase of polypeptide subunit release factors